MKAYYVGLDVHKASICIAVYVGTLDPHRLFIHDECQTIPAALALHPKHSVFNEEDAHVQRGYFAHTHPRVKEQIHQRQKFAY